MTKAVFFDLDGTLYDRDALVQALVLEQHAAFAADLGAISRRQFVDRIIEMDDHGYGDKTDLYRQAVEEWNLRPDLATRLVEHFWVCYDGFCHLPEDTRMTLQALKDHGKQIGVITNGSTVRQRSKLEALGLSKIFDVVLISEAEGVRKPESEIFMRALRRCGVDPCEAVFVGDHPEADIEGAKNAGLAPIWKHVPYWSLVSDDVPTVHQLSEILPICLDR